MQHLKSLIYRLFKYKSLRVLRFFRYRHSSHRRNDPHLLFSRIAYEGHHLEKALKRPYSASHGLQRAALLQQLLEEARQRELRQPEIMDWAQELLATFTSKQANKKSVLITPIPPTDITPPSLATTQQEIMDAIFKRSSIRFWQPQDIALTLIHRIVEAGLQGALSCNRQTLRIGLHRNPVADAGSGCASNKSMVSKAPVILYIALDKRLYYEKYAAALDAGSFCANALLAAEALGLGGCWMYGCETLDQQKLRKRFKLSRHFYFYSAITLGYPAEKAHKPPRKSIDSVIILPAEESQ